MSAAVTHHIYTAGDRMEKVAVLSGHRAEVDWEAEVIDDDQRDAFIEAVENEPGDYIIVCQQLHKDDPMPTFLYHLTVVPPRDPETRVLISCRKKLTEAHLASRQ